MQIGRETVRRREEKEKARTTDGGRLRTRAEGSVVRNAMLVPSERCAAKGEISQSPAVRGRCMFRERAFPFDFAFGHEIQVIAINRSEVIVDL